MLPPDPFYLPPASPGVKISIFSELDGRTTELLFSEFPIRVGRNRQNDLVLRHEYVSQYHAEVHMVEGQLSIMQVGKSNSVRVDGHKLHPREHMALSGQEEIRVVPFSMRLELMVAPAALPAPASAAAQSKTVMPAEEPPRPILPPPTGWEQQPQAQPTPGWNQGGAMPPPLAPPRDGGQEALALLDRLAQRYLGRSLAGGQEVTQLGTQLEQALDIFLRFFVAMQRGQVQFYEQMGLPPPADYLNPAEQTMSAAHLGGLLLNPGDAQGVSALEGAFESLKVHQVAVLRGLEAGVRSLLRRVSPHSVTKVAGRLTRSPGIRTLWETYRQMHEDLAEEDQEAFKVIYGGQFRKAYLRLMQAGRQGQRG